MKKSQKCKMRKGPLNSKIKSSRVGYSFIKRVLKLNVYWNIHFFSDQLLFFLLRKLMPPIFSANQSSQRFFKAPNADSRTGSGWQINLKPSVRVIYFFSKVKRYYQFTVNSILDGFMKQTSTEQSFFHYYLCEVLELACIASAR